MSGRVAIVGCGLIGGSIGLALRRAGYHVTATDLSDGTLEQALALGAADEVAGDAAAAARSADVAVVATPVGEIAATAGALAAAGRPGLVITDVGSTKTHVVEDAEAAVGESSRFVGGHPMAGSEREGIEGARADLFDGALWILTPTARTDEEAYRVVNRLVQAAGARTMAMDPPAHDRLVAFVSHLPYALATTLMDLAAGQDDDRVMAAAAGSFRDVTRTAGSNPSVWRDILSANRDAVLGALDSFAGALGEFRDALDRQDWGRLEKAILRARDGRRRLPLKSAHAPARPVTLEIPVPDRAGVLADITTAFGQLGVNIEDLRVDHSGAGGVVQLVVDESDAQVASAALAERGYRVLVAEL